MYNDGNIKAVQEVHLDSWKADLHNTGDIVSVQGDVKLYANQNLYNGNEDSSGNITAKNQIELTAYKGNVVNYGNMESQTSSVALTGAGIYKTELNNNYDVFSDITNYGSITAAEAVLLCTANGNINNLNQITSQNSTVTIKAEQHQDYLGQVAVGDIRNGAGETFDTDAEITAAKGISLQAVGSILNVGDNLVTDVGDINVQTQGSIANIGDYSLAKDGNIKVTAGQEVINNGEYRINGNGSINVKATGVVTETEGEKTAAGGDIINFGNYYTKSGNITMTSHD